MFKPLTEGRRTGPTIAASVRLRRRCCATLGNENDMYTQLEKRLNLIHGSPAFCLRMCSDGSMDVLQIAEIPEDGRDYWVHATVTFACGQTASAAFLIGSGGGSHHSIKIRANDHWFDSDAPELPERLGLTREQIFPFDWQYSVPVANDIYHPTPTNPST